MCASEASSPSLVEGVVYFGSNDKHLYAVDIETGEEKWKFETGAAVSSSPSLVDGVVYFGSADGHIYAVDIELENHLYALDIELVDKKVSKTEEKPKEISLFRKDLLISIWSGENSPADFIYNQTYETEITHKEADWIEEEKGGITRPNRIDPNESTYNPDALEVVEIEVESFVDDMFLEHFCEYLNTDSLNEAQNSKQDIEDWINDGIENLCDCFRGYAVLDGSKLYPEVSNNDVWNHPKTIYLEIESPPEIKLEDLNPEWNKDNYMVDDQPFDDIKEDL